MNDEDADLVAHANAAVYKALRANQPATQSTSSSQLLIDVNPDNPRSAAALQADQIEAIAGEPVEPTAVAASLPGLESGVSLKPAVLE